jgi:hypothetical protein
MPVSTRDLKENEIFRRRREALTSRWDPGAAMSHSELAEVANEYLARTGRDNFLDAATINRYERGQIHYPRADRREALRAVMGAATDADLGFYNSWLGDQRGSRSLPFPKDAEPPVELDPGEPELAGGHGGGHGSAQVVESVRITVDVSGVVSEELHEDARPVAQVRLIGSGDPDWTEHTLADGSVATVRIELLFPNRTGQTGTAPAPGLNPS